MNIAGELCPAKRIAIAVLTAWPMISLPASGQMTATLEPAAAAAYEKYVHGAEAEMAKRLDGRKPFLWLDEQPRERAAAVQGEVVIQSLAPGQVEVEKGLIHDWIGVIFIPGATNQSVTAFFQDFGRHPDVYKEVLEAKSLGKQGNKVKVYRRLLKKKILTAVLDTENEAEYRDLGQGRYLVREHSTKIVEVDNYGSAKERTLAAGEGRGFLWRLNSYWRLRETNGGVMAELRTISLSRDVPTGLGWMVNPFVKKVPEESLRSTLESTRDALQ